MSLCPTCGHHLARTHRTLAQKLMYAEAFRCPKCHSRVKRLHPTFDVNLTFFFSRHTHCIRCGSANVERLSKRDRIDSMSRSLVSQIFRLTLAPIRRCPSCRLQYYDWRPAVPSEGTSPSVHASQSPSS